jgi:hypothetical protein
VKEENWRIWCKLWEICHFIYKRREGKEKWTCMLITENYRNVHMVMAIVFNGRNPVNKILRWKPILCLKHNWGLRAKKHSSHRYCWTASLWQFCIGLLLSSAPQPKLKTETMYQQDQLVSFCNLTGAERFNSLHFVPTEAESVACHYVVLLPHYWILCIVCYEY